MIAAPEALDRLREGNRRFASALREGGMPARRVHREALVGEQAPFAVILGCSDARVPAEIVFDQGPGDLFVVRVAGNITAPSQVGSVEFAAAQFGTRLVVVLGHSRCGAVLATLDQIRRPAASRSPNLRAIVERIRPSIEALVSADPPEDPHALAARAVRANIRASAEHLRHGSSILEALIREEGLVVAGAEYSLETGTVDFFEGLPGGD